MSRLYFYSNVIFTPKSSFYPFYILSVLSSDRIRTTNNILSDCYCATIVEHLSKTELIALDAEIEHNEQNAKVPPRERRCGQTTAVVVEVLHPDSEVAK